MNCNLRLPIDIADFCLSPVKRQNLQLASDLRTESSHIPLAAIAIFEADPIRILLSLETCYSAGALGYTVSL
jgi:hypothetical protein